MVIQASGIFKLIIEAVRTPKKVSVIQGQSGLLLISRVLCYSEMACVVASKRKSVKSHKRTAQGDPSFPCL